MPEFSCSGIVPGVKLPVDNNTTADSFFDYRPEDVFFTLSGSETSLTKYPGIGIVFQKNRVWHCFLDKLNDPGFLPLRQTGGTIHYTLAPIDQAADAYAQAENPLTVYPGL
ncbi:hypothetical protein ES705_49055 [subsurface metagenome]